MVGWTAARVLLLQARPLQCHRCLEKGHVRQRCQATVDRSDLCYRCEKPDHKAAGCAAEPRCPVCADILGKPAAHRCGGPACVTPRKKGKKGENGAQPPLEQTGGTAPPVTEQPPEKAMDTES